MVLCCTIRTVMYPTRLQCDLNTSESIDAIPEANAMLSYVPLMNLLMFISRLADELMLADWVSIFVTIKETKDQPIGGDYSFSLPRPG